MGIIYSGVTNPIIAPTTNRTIETSTIQLKPKKINATICNTAAKAIKIMPMPVFLLIHPQTKPNTEQPIYLVSSDLVSFK